MPNNLYNSTQNNNLQSEFNRFQQNPFQFLTEKNINIPQEYLSNPQNAIQYLMNSGQINQQGINQIIQKARMFGFKI